MGTWIFSLRIDGKKIFGHSGGCPGYRSNLMIDPNKKHAFIAMINAAGTNPSRYTRGIRTAIQKAGDNKKEKPKGVNLEDYAGLYNAQPWSGENAIIPWQGKLAIFGLPNSNPAQGMSLYKHIKDDTFRRIRSDDTLGEEMIFERDESGKVIRFWHHSNYENKIK